MRCERRAELAPAIETAVPMQHAVRAVNGYFELMFAARLRNTEIASQPSADSTRDASAEGELHRSAQGATIAMQCLQLWMERSEGRAEPCFDGARHCGSSIETGALARAECHDRPLVGRAAAVGTEDGDCVVTGPQARGGEIELDAPVRCSAQISDFTDRM